MNGKSTRGMSMTLIVITVAQGRSLGKGWAALKQDHEQQQRLRFNLCATLTRDLVSATGEHACSVVCLGV